MLSTMILLAALTVPTEPGKHAYDVALEYCSERGGLAQYTVSGSTVTFSCSDDISKIITIHTK